MGMRLGYLAMRMRPGSSHENEAKTSLKLTTASSREVLQHPHEGDVDHRREDEERYHPGEDRAVEEERSPEQSNICGRGVGGEWEESLARLIASVQHTIRSCV